MSSLTVNRVATIASSSPSAGRAGEVEGHGRPRTSASADHDRVQSNPTRPSTPASEASLTRGLAAPGGGVSVGARDPDPPKKKKDEYPRVSFHLSRGTYSWGAVNPGPEVTHWTRLGNTDYTRFTLGARINRFVGVEASFATMPTRFYVWPKTEGEPEPDRWSNIVAPGGFSTEVPWKTTHVAVRGHLPLGDSPWVPRLSAAAGVGVASTGHVSWHHFGASPMYNGIAHWDTRLEMEPIKGFLIGAEVGGDGLIPRTGSFTTWREWAGAKQNGVDADESSEWRWSQSLALSVGIRL